MDNKRCDICWKGMISGSLHVEARGSSISKNTQSKSHSKLFTMQLFPRTEIAIEE